MLLAITIWDSNIADPTENSRTHLEWNNTTTIFPKQFIVMILVYILQWHPLIPQHRYSHIMIRKASNVLMGNNREILTALTPIPYHYLINNVYIMYMVII
jgi:hypothetical protein